MARECLEEVERRSASVKRRVEFMIIGRIVYELV